MAEERDVAERLGVVETQLEAVRETLSKVSESLDKVAETLSTFVKSSAVVEARLLAYEERLTSLTLFMNTEFARGREHMNKTDDKVDKLQHKCDQTESLRIAGQRHLDEAPKELAKTSEAWITSGTAMRLVLAFMGLLTFLVGLVLFTVSRGSSGLPTP